MKHLVRAMLVAAVLLAGLAAAQVEILYWQYQFDARFDAMEQLIEQFNAENPDIVVRQETFPYDAYQQQVAASLPAGEGPDVVQLFYGWLPTWQRSGYVEPLPAEFFDAAELDATFVPMAQAAKLGGTYYGLPTAVRSLGLFYNKDLLSEAGYDSPPATWDEFIEIAKALTIKRGPRFEQIGWGVAPQGQEHHVIREVLTRQFGTAPYSDDGTEVLYDSEAGIEAFAFYTGLITEHELGVIDFVPGTSGYREGFRSLQNIAMIFDGSFAIGATQNTAEFEWGVTELPVGPSGVKSNFGSFWMNGLTPNALADPAKTEAAAKFLQYVTSPEAMELWLDVVGELPARQALIADPELAADPVFGPFIRSLEYAHATTFVDESAQRAVIMDAVNRVVLEGVDPEASWLQAAAEEQALLDQFAQ
ncbi:MAG: extracellular solute-binding protein [Trueperaceae bacterium]|nr:MAG: extracellular solute-binding protein [Trueperaceae bacterium]